MNLLLRQHYGDQGGSFRALMLLANVAQGLHTFACEETRAIFDKLTCRNQLFSEVKDQEFERINTDL
ncbi:uncharacterized protein PHALS_04577 [Plasmopara halstedii]|uniref:Uncharacterized protein n=1 Tax=Plasmopara halstedii TaxID=4781 RepID=A0A0P1A9W3_PLAHL|nr:uncharacterized protein PHALS_04577 [Plasmopara halstedii]CEG37124.1 hypothetical protein PHALS_04577 [Plasmopara halstedii]|eukprot:XP_024573493.1 hypothetical protein PHALS_04577 [Plasmopara halstedii]